MITAAPLNPQTLSSVPSAAEVRRGREVADDAKLREAFDSFVGEAFYGQMLAAMHKTVGKPAYFHGGRAEEVFSSQLDQALAQQMTKANAGDFSGKMFDQFRLLNLHRV